MKRKKNKAAKAAKAVQKAAKAAEKKKQGGIPTEDTELVIWLDNFIPWLDINADKAKITVVRLAEITGHAEVYKDDVVKLQGGNASELLEAEKKAAKAVIVADVQGLIDFELKSPDFTTADLIAAGVYVPPREGPVRDTRIFESPVPEIRNRERNVIRGRTRCENSTKWRMPVEKHYRNVEFCGKVVDSERSPVPTKADCDIHFFGSKSSFVQELEEGNSGKYIVIYVRYTNHFPFPGPWSGPYGATIL